MKYATLSQWIIAFLICFLSISLSVAQAKDSAVIVFDASGSMWGQIKDNGKNKAKIEIAREVMGTLINDWNEDIELGLMAYGHREKGNCSDIEMLQKVTVVDSDKILGIINKIVPKGKTPISESLKQAAETLRYTEDPATVILISDGEETCNADPCAVSKELEAKGINFTTHVIGFDIKNNKKALKQLKCIAENTGGQFYEAEDTTSLKKALVKVKKAVVDPRPTLCKTYADNAVIQERSNIEKECSFEGELWTTQYATHFDWCVALAIGSELPDQKSKERNSFLKKCTLGKTTSTKKSLESGMGTFEFEWDNGGYWKIFRGDTSIGGGRVGDLHAGKTKKKLQSGLYTIKAEDNNFEPFEVTIEKGKTLTINPDEIGGMLEFEWNNGGYWKIYRGDTSIGGGRVGDLHGGKTKKKLQSGLYTIRSEDNNFEPFEVTIEKGETLTIDK